MLPVIMICENVKTVLIWLYYDKLTSYLFHHVIYFSSVNILNRCVPKAILQVGKKITSSAATAAADRLNSSDVLDLSFCDPNASWMQRVSDNINQALSFSSL